MGACQDATRPDGRDKAKMQEFYIYNKALIFRHYWRFLKKYAPKWALQEPYIDVTYKA
nr:MAG TPA: hypothetical protein [Caudoviricetes sp.]